MRDFTLPRLSFCALAAATFCALPSPAPAFLGLFEKKEKVAPATDERQRQESEATALLMQARQAQNEGRTSRAQGIYQQAGWLETRLRHERRLSHLISTLLGDPVHGRDAWSAA